MNGHTLHGIYDERPNLYFKIITLNFKQMGPANPKIKIGLKTLWPADDS